MSYEIKFYRLSSNRSQAEMANMLGLSISQISMVENGKRTLSAEAQRKFASLHKEDTIPHQIEDFSSINDSLTKVIFEHVEDLKKSIPERIGDLQSELHLKSKKINKWKKQVDLAIAKLIYIQGMDAFYANGEMPAHTKKKLIGERYRAEATIQTILNQQPELEVSKIISMQAELDYLTRGKGNAKSRIGFDVNDWVSNLTKQLNPSKPDE